MSLKRKKLGKSEKWLSYLPKNAAKIVKLNFPGELSERQIYRIIIGECADKHGILPIAISMAKQNKKELDKLERQKQQLASKRSPSKPNKS